MGWQHINQDLVDQINHYYHNYFNPYLNYHRPCAFPTLVIDKKGREQKVYSVYRPPYEALKTITEAKNFLRPGKTLEQLDIIAYQYSDNEFAAIMREEERKLFEQIRKRDQEDGSQRKS